MRRLLPFLLAIMALIVAPLRAAALPTEAADTLLPVVPLSDDEADVLEQRLDSMLGEANRIVQSDTFTLTRRELRNLRLARFKPKPARALTLLR